ncbi:F0F1 ATP synthase subunit B [Candidatus Curtissbacteria bacterium]|nr:F0F1 ATP synthase subunit B [Candidatus Curtissbacteria bacterium]
MEILHNFGIQPIYLLAQIVNFLIILFLLKKFFYKPITKALEDRKKRIEESLKNADLIEKNLKMTEEKSIQILEEARESAQELITQANKESERISQQALDEAKKTIDEAKKEAIAQSQIQKRQMQKQLEKETLVLVAEVVKKVLGRTLKTQEKQELTSKAITEITKQM